MLATPRKIMVGAVALGALGIMALPMSADAAKKQTILGLSASGKLTSFAVNKPEKAKVLGAPTGLVGDARLIGIDYRVQNGRLYGVGNAGGIYVIGISGSKETATKVSQLSVALSGTSFGVDFNPAANRLRVVSDTGQNLRHNIDDPAGLPAAGVTANDAALTYPAVGANPPTPGTGITAAAYTNNDLSATTGTTLFDIDTNLDQVVIQSPANAGLLAATGKLKVNAGTPAGFDIYSDLTKGETVSNTGYAVLQINGKSGFFEVNLLTGRAVLEDYLPTPYQTVDIAIPLEK